MFFSPKKERKQILVYTTIIKHLNCVMHWPSLRNCVLKYNSIGTLLVYYSRDTTFCFIVVQTWRKINARNNTKLLYNYDFNTHYYLRPQTTLLGDNCDNLIWLANEVIFQTQWYRLPLRSNRKSLHNCVSCACIDADLL